MVQGTDIHVAVPGARIGDGDFAHRIDVVTGDEIEHLAGRINDMAKDLAA